MQNLFLIISYCLRGHRKATTHYTRQLSVQLPRGRGQLYILVQELRAI